MRALSRGHPCVLLEACACVVVACVSHGGVLESAAVRLCLYRSTDRNLDLESLSVEYGAAAMLQPKPSLTFYDVLPWVYAAVFERLAFGLSRLSIVHSPLFSSVYLAALIDDS